MGVQVHFASCCSFPAGWLAGREFVQGLEVHQCPTSRLTHLCLPCLPCLPALPAPPACLRHLPCLPAPPAQPAPPACTTCPVCLRRLPACPACLPAPPACLPRLPACPACLHCQQDLDEVERQDVYKRTLARMKKVHLDALIDLTREAAK